MQRLNNCCATKFFPPSFRPSVAKKVFDKSQKQYGFAAVFVCLCVSAKCIFKPVRMFEYKTEAGFTLKKCVFRDSIEREGQHLSICFYADSRFVRAGDKKSTERIMLIFGIVCV